MFQNNYRYIASEILTSFKSISLVTSAFIESAIYVTHLLSLLGFSRAPEVLCQDGLCKVDPSLLLLVAAASPAVIEEQPTWKLIDSDLPASFCQETLLIRTKWLSSFLCLSPLPTPGHSPVQPDWQLNS